MPEVTQAKIPLDSLVVSYAEVGAFVDCYYVEIQKIVALEDYIESFFTTPLFKMERAVLSVATFRLASDREATELSIGKSEDYSIWTVEKRTSNQIILRDFTKKTRSWLMVEKSTTSKEGSTRLFFGSVVVPKKVSENGQATFGFLFHALSRPHQLYSKALLSAAYKKLLRKFDSI